jgi:hypothetical protein
MHIRVIYLLLINDYLFIISFISLFMYLIVNFYAV